MKLSKIFGTLALVIILALLMIAIPAAPARAVVYEEEFSISPTKGEIDDSVTISGYLFNTGKVYIYFSAYEADLGDDVDSLDAYELVATVTAAVDPQYPDYGGAFEDEFAVPDSLASGTAEDVHGGTYYVYCTYSKKGEIVALAEFRVMAGQMTLNPEDGAVGTTVKISGENFDKSRTITVEYDDDTIDITSGKGKTDKNGKFTCTIIIPESVAGEHTITVTDDTGVKATAEFTVQPKMTMNPTSGLVGAKVTVSGTGFAEEETVTITFDALSVGKTETDANGSFGTAFFDVPAVGAGAHSVKAKDQSNHTTTAEFTISINATVTPTSGSIGTKITISGSGFAVNRTVSITYDGAEVATSPVDNRGAFSTSFNAPVSAHGSHSIVASDNTNKMTFTFTMESTPPPIPEPLLPPMGAKEKALAVFDWEDVSDPSGVTYTLQIATDEEFKTGSMVLEKKGLTKSGYTLTELEKLKSTKKEAPYYWRVRAIDRASNEGPWSGAGEFYVGGFPIGLGGWLTYVLIVFAGVVLLLIGVWIGRKTSYSA